MRSIVSDASPINYLVLIGEIDLLPNLFEEVFIPAAVYAELQHQRTPPAVFTWAEALPNWARLRQPSRFSPIPGLGAGETEAIALAEEMGISAILIDERKGRRAAAEHGLNPLRTLNILYAANMRGFVDFERAIRELRKTSFRMRDDMVAVLLDRVRARKRR